MILSFSWHRIAKVEPDRSYTALFGFVELQSVLLLPTFVQFAIRIERQLSRSPGVVAYRSAMDATRLRFYHLSAWSESDAIGSFVHVAPHRRAMERLNGRLGVTAFRYWDIRGSDLPLHVKRELHRFAGLQHK